MTGQVLIALNAITCKCFKLRSGAGPWGKVSHVKTTTLTQTGAMGRNAAAEAPLHCIWLLYAFHTVKQIIFRKRDQ